MKMRKLAAIGLAATMAVSMCLPAMAQSTNSGVTPKDYTLTFMADPTVVDGDFIYEPVNYTIPAGTSEATTLGELLETNQVDFHGSTSYISGFPCAAAKSFQLTDAQKAAFPDVAFDTRIMVAPSETGQDGYLSEKDFTGYAGWMMTVDNKTLEPDSSSPYGAYYYSLGSSIADLEKYGVLDDNDVVLEMFFSMNMGADIGMGDAYLPTTIIPYGGGVYSYDWSGPSVMVPKIDKNDRTELVFALASNKTSKNYEKGLAVLKDLTSTSEQIIKAIAAL